MDYVFGLFNHPRCIWTSLFVHYLFYYSADRTLFSFKIYFKKFKEFSDSYEQVPTKIIKNWDLGGTCMSQSVKYLTLDFKFRSWPQSHEIEPCNGFHSRHGTCLIFSLSLSFYLSPLSPAHVHVLSLKKKLRFLIMQYKNWDMSTNSNLVDSFHRPNQLNIQIISLISSPEWNGLWIELVDQINVFT